MQGDSGAVESVTRSGATVVVITPEGHKINLITFVGNSSFRFLA